MSKFGTHFPHQIVESEYLLFPSDFLQLLAVIWAGFSETRLFTFNYQIPKFCQLPLCESLANQTVQCGYVGFY